MGKILVELTRHERHANWTAMRNSCMTGLTWIFLAASERKHQKFGRSPLRMILATGPEFGPLSKNKIPDHKQYHSNPYGNHVAPVAIRQNN